MVFLLRHLRRFPPICPRRVAFWRFKLARLPCASRVVLFSLSGFVCHVLFGAYQFPMLFFSMHVSSWRASVGVVFCLFPHFAIVILFSSLSAVAASPFLPLPPIGYVQFPPPVVLFVRFFIVFGGYVFCIPLYTIFRIIPHWSSAVCCRWAFSVGCGPSVPCLSFIRPV